MGDQRESDASKNRKIDSVCTRAGPISYLPLSRLVVFSLFVLSSAPHPVQLFVRRIPWDIETADGFPCDRSASMSQEACFSRQCLLVNLIAAYRKRAISLLQHASNGVTALRGWHRSSCVSVCHDVLRTMSCLRLSKDKHAAAVSGLQTADTSAIVVDPFITCSFVCQGAGEEKTWGATVSGFDLGLLFTVGCRG
jgi:hypothetical protein